jgi:hypothetical protein
MQYSCSIHDLVKGIGKRETKSRQVSHTNYKYAVCRQRYQKQKQTATEQ